MKKSLKLAIIGVLALTAGISLANNSYTAGIKEDTKDAYENIGVSLRKANIGASETVDVSRTFVQYGSEGTRNFVRFATAISGPVKSIKYVRTVAGLDTKEKEVTTVYKGIQAAGGVYYYNGSEVVTTQSELADKYYWACYTIEFTSDTYKAADITAYIVVESEEEGAEVIESTPRTESFNDLKAEADKTLYIHTVEELKAFRDEVNAGTNYKGKIVALANDIDLTNENWTPIGAYKSEFQGTFDGNGYTVSNLKIDDLEVFGAGLFGYAINATFKNVNMHNVNIRADQEVGTICGSAKTSTFDNIHVTGTLNLYADYAYAAGIVSQGYVKVSNCSVLPEGTGTITVREKTMAGGITAWLGEGNSSVTNCHVKNLDITAWTSVGSITGLLHYNNVMDNCSAENITLTKTRDGGFPAIGAACGNWVAKANGAEYLTKITNSSFKNIELNGGNSTITDAQQVCDFSSLYGAPYSGTTVDPFKVEIKNVTLEGITDNVDRGSSNIYYINDLAGLKAFRDEVNAGNSFAGKTIALTKDIDLSNEEWKPIGYDEYFEGNFDGKGNTISNLKVNIDFGGAFIAFPKGATIKNLNLHNVNNYAEQQVGTIAGWCNNDTIVENCHVTGTVNLESRDGYVGGIASDGDVTISNCSIIAEGTGILKVNNSTTAGGIVANLSSGCTVSNCHAENLNISATKMVGGIVGQLYPDTVLDNCSVENVTLNKTSTTGLPSIGLACGAWVDLDSNPATAITNCKFNNVELNGAAVIASQYADCDFSVIYGSPYNGKTIKFNVDLTNNTLNNVVDNVNHTHAVTTFAELKAAVKAGKDVVLGNDIVMEEVLTIKSGSINGKGFKLIQGEACVNTYALLYIENATEEVTIKNVVFDGVKGGAAIRTLNADIVIDNCTFSNGAHTQIQGLVRLTCGNATVKNSKFLNNTAKFALTFNFDAGNATDVLNVENCEFANNTCNDTAVLYYVTGAKCILNGNKFVDNNVNSTGNAATAYLGFTENNVVTNNVFSGNKVTSTHATSKRIAGALMIGYEAVISGNAFVNNSVKSGFFAEELAQSVLASVYYTDIDLSNNYWGGNAPVNGVDYYVEYPDSHTVIVDSYLSTYNF